MCVYNMIELSIGVKKHYDVVRKRFYTVSFSWYKIIGLKRILKLNSHAVHVLVGLDMLFSYSILFSKSFYKQFNGGDKLNDRSTTLQYSN